ncbi:MAG: hypothetical protein M3198_10590, partial [Actinomycetota bacterium]|nr:hypothetical protein [Actinomycetota bacterium]
MFERFTERARQVVVLAQEEARILKHNYIGTEHILLGLLREEEGLAARVLESLDITVERVRAQVVRIVGSGEEVTSGQIPFTPRAKKVLELALREALSLGHNYIGTEHILLGLVRENEGVAARILLDFDADSEKIRNEVIRMLSAPGRHPGASAVEPFFGTARISRRSEVIIDYLKRNHRMMVGEETADGVDHEVGSCPPGGRRKADRGQRSSSSLWVAEDGGPHRGGATYGARRGGLAATRSGACRGGLAVTRSRHDVHAGPRPLVKKQGRVRCKYARAVDREPAGAEGDRRLLMAVALGPAIGVVPSLRTDDLIDLSGHQLVEHSESGGHRKSHKALPGGAGELAKGLLDVVGQFGRTRLIGRGDLRQRYVAYGGSSCPRWTWLAPRHAPSRSGRGGRTAASSSTD